MRHGEEPSPRAARRARWEACGPIGRRAALGLGAALGVPALLGACGAPPDPRSREAGEPVRVPYARASARQFGHLHLPPGTGEDGTRPLLPVVVVIHGGGWSSGSHLSGTTDISRDLASHGAAVWNIEYRGDSGFGSWPRTYEDVAAAVDFVPRLGAFAPFRPDVGSVHVTGNSAGGSLAAWVASRTALPAGAPGARVRQRVHSCVPLCGVYDLALAYREGDRYVRGLLGGTPEERPLEYRLASPAAHVPTGIPVTVLHGRDDDVVPVRQAETYARAARRAGDTVELVLMDGVGHGGWTDLGSPVWEASRAVILGRLRL